MHKTTIVRYRRQRLGKTNYKRRLTLLKSMTPRLVIRKSADNISAQIIEYHEDGDKVLVSGHSRELAKLGWKLSRSNIPAAYLTGLMIGKKAKEKKIAKVIPDFGYQRSTAGSRLYAVIKGIKDAGMDISVPDEILPDEKRTGGMHIQDYANQNKDLFKRYQKDGIAADKIAAHIEEIRKKLI